MLELFLQKILSGYGGGRSLLANPSSISSTPLDRAQLGRVNGGLVILRGYLTALGTGKQIGCNAFASDFSGVLANPMMRRPYSTEGPNKKS